MRRGKPEPRGPIATAFATLIEAFRVKDDDMPDSVMKLYQKALEKVPPALLSAAVERCVTTRQWFPKVSELLLDCETVRRELMAAHPYDGCADCEDQIGWRTVQLERGSAVQRCPCFARHQERMKFLGLDGGPLALPPARESEMVQVSE